MSVPSRQEMFNRAWRGLKSQGWRRAKSGSFCMYLTADGRRCAWGWVDPEGTEGTAVAANADVVSLRASGQGLAARLPREDVEWACRLQNAHDRLQNAHGVFRDLKASMETFAAAHGLTIPED